MRFIFCLLMLLTLMGCAFGQKTSFEGRSSFEFKPIEKSNAIVAAHDLRPYVQSGNKNPNFSGISKSIAGIPYDVTTQSGGPLAYDLGKMIANTMKYRGTFATAKDIPYTWTQEDVRKNLLGTAPEAEVYYIRMNEWKTETHFRTALHYNLQLTVYNSQRQEIATNEDKGLMYVDQNITGRENLPAVITTVLGDLFADKKPSGNTATTSVKMDSSSDIPKKEVSLNENKEKLPEEIKKNIRSKCEFDFPGDFVQQVSCIKAQETAWSEINN